MPTKIVTSIFTVPIAVIFVPLPQFIQMEVKTFRQKFITTTTEKQQQQQQQQQYDNYYGSPVHQVFVQ